MSAIPARHRLTNTADICRRRRAGGVDLPEAVTLLAEAALATGVDPDEVWCAAGSGVLARALAQAWPDSCFNTEFARRHVVQVGRGLARKDMAGATIHIYPRPFADVAKAISPFPSDPHYDAKEWETMTARKGPGRVVFWNVAGPARPWSCRHAARL
ncbi:hypothetical protein [Candidatus Raskinella chloraquaticus]|uniref:hypothetical protein n=1 Tax=Candidatus Raskinella chloraquaticus TaxID=1951219 RepID=UPI00268CDEB5